METNITFILNDTKFEFPCSIDLIQQIPSQYKEIANMLIQNHIYNVESPVNNGIFQSFLDYWLNKTEPEINEGNIWEFYLLSKEFGIMVDYIKSPQFDKLFNVSYLIHSEHNPPSKIDFTQNIDKSIIEQRISSHLKEYLDASPDKLFQIPITSLYNIFIQGVDDLEEHETAYNFIIEFAQKQSPDLYVLLNLLDGNKIKVPEVQSESFIERQNHYGFSPKNIISDEVLLQQNDQNKLLKNMNNQIIIENKKLSNINDVLTKEKDKLTKEKDKLTKENDKLTKENDKLTKENDKLTKENQQKNLEELQSNNLHLNMENDKFKNEIPLAENEQLSLNKNKFPSEITENINDFGSNFSLFKSLGGGPFGYVYVIINSKSLDRFAIKTSLSFLNEGTNSLKCINKLLIINNPAILEIKYIRFKEASNEQSHNKKQLVIATNYMPKGSLNQENNLTKMNQTDQYICILGIALGMQYLHSSQIVHGNLKLSNVFLDDNSFPLISDFGLSRYYKNSFLNKDSIFFIAPEILTEKIIEPNFKTDVYSYAFVVYFILTKQIPKINEPLYLFIQRIIKGKRPNISNNDINKFFQKCWSYNPSERPSFDEIIEEITSNKFVSYFQIDITRVKHYIILFISKQPIAKQIYEKISNFGKKLEKNTPEANPMNFNNSQIKNIYEANPMKVDISSTENISELNTAKADDINETQQKKPFTVVLYGSSGVGKTTFINSYTKKYRDIRATIGFDPNILIIQTENGDAILDVYDTSGTLTWQPISLSYLRNADAIIFFINVSFTNEINFLQDIIDKAECSNKFCYLLPMHCNEVWRITEKEILAFAEKNNLRLCRASYDDYDSIELMFKAIANDLMAKKDEFGKVGQEDENAKCLIH